MKTISLLILFLSSVVALSLLGGPTVSEAHATTAGFKAGRIIDDSVMTDAKSMSASQIQSFLNSKVPTCDTNGQQLSEYGGPDLNKDGKVQRWEWGKANYNQTKFICLKNWKTSGGTSAAQIIYDKAQKYSINPKVLIVLLQKEQGLVTDTWPLDIQYRTATGYGCPDTSACDSTYYGFVNQVDWAAHLFHSVITRDPNWYSPYIKGSNYIRWSPTSSCGGSTVSVQNWSTASLYDYTPYQPNKAALDAGYGTGNSCSSYGNRNFYNYFTDWFGTTFSPSYSSRYVSQSANPSLLPDTQTTVYITLRNTGNQTWYDDTTASAAGKKPIHLSTSRDINKPSDFADTSWGSYKNRPAVQFTTVYDSTGAAYDTNPHIVKEGETAKFQFTLSIPDQYPAGSYREYFQLVQEGGIGPIPISIIPWITITVQKDMQAQYSTQSSYPSLRGGETSNGNYITFKNTGNTNWYDNATAGANDAKPVRLATFNPLNHASDFADSSWGADKNRPTGTFATVYDKNGTAYSSNPHVVKPGESAKFQFTITAPDNYTPGTYREYFGPIEEGGTGVIPVNVTPWVDITTESAPAAKPASGSSAEGVAQTMPLMRTYSFKNTGTTTWSSSSTTLKLTSGSSTGIAGSGWLDATTPARLNEASVAPGATGTFTVGYRPTASPGTYSLSFEPAINGTSIAVSPMKVKITVASPLYKASYHSQSSFPTMLQNTTKQVYFRFKNVGNVTWYDTQSASAAGVRPVVLAATDPINRMSSFNANFTRENRPTTIFSKVFESDGSTLASNQHAALPGQIVEFGFTLTAPDDLAPGSYKEMFQPIVEGGQPWSMQQVAWLYVHVTDSDNTAVYYDQSSYPTIARGGTGTFFFRFQNKGNSTWMDSASVQNGLQPVHLATTDPINRISAFNASFSTPNRPNIQFSAVYESDGTTLAPDQHVVKPNQIAKFAFTLKVPANKPIGIYKEVFQPIIEGGRPWDMNQIAWLYLTVK